MIDVLIVILIFYECELKEVDLVNLTNGLNLENPVTLLYISYLLDYFQYILFVLHHS